MKTIHTFLQMLAEGTPFAFARFNDGEMICIKEGTNGKLVARGDQVVTEQTRTVLRDCIAKKLDNLWIGMPCSNCFKSHRALAESLVGQPPEFWCSANVFNNSNLQLTRKALPEAVRDRPVIWAGGESHTTDQLADLIFRTFKGHIRFADQHAFDDELQNARDMHHDFEPGDVVLLSCGPLATALAVLWYEKNPETTFIDLGCVFDPQTRNVVHECHKGRYARCPAGECS